MATAEHIARLTSLVAKYWAAEEAVLNNQSYKMPDGRELVRADLDKIRKGRKETQDELDRAQGVRVVRGRARAGVIGGC